MLAKLSSLPGLAASLVLAISALLLCNHYDCFLPWYESPHGLSYIPASRNVSGQSSFGIDTTSNLSTAKGIGLPFGHQDQVQEFSIPSIHFSKRIPLDLEAARCKGETLYQRMKKSYADYLLDKENNKGREFSQKDVDNGWSVVQHNDVELEGWWDQAFSDRITPGQTHDHLQDPGQFIGITQNKAFRSDQGGLVRVRP